MGISQTMVSRLNEQVALEFSAAYKYLAMSCAFEDMGLRILSRLFLDQEAEEREHAMKIVRYLQEVDGKVTLGGVPEPPASFKSVADIVQAALESEEYVTAKIHELVALSEKEGDFATRSFLNWFVDEQVEEVSKMKGLLDLVRLAGDNMLQVEARVRHEMMADGN